MGFPRISYNRNTIDFLRAPQLLDIQPVRAVTRNKSASGKAETLNIAAGFTVRVVFNGLRMGDATESALKTALVDLSLWAQAGAAWIFTKDSAVTVNTTLDGAAVAGVSSIPVTSATGVVSGSRYAIES